MSSGPKNHRLRFATIPYANGMPLSHFLPAVCPGAEVTCGPPATLADLLLAGRTDAALMPVFDVLTHGELAMIDGLGVCADDEVQSVLLKCHRPLPEIRVVAMDPASHTSNALSGILLRRHFALDARMKYVREGEPFDAAVMIGDRALCAPPAPCGDIDLAGAWKQMTGLPFVFAVWGYRASGPRAEELAAIAHEAQQAGLAAIGELADLMSQRLGLPPKRCLAYLSKAIHYDVGPRERDAIALFGKLLKEH